MLPCKYTIGGVRDIMLPLKLNIYEKNVLHLRVDSILRTVICKDIFNPQIMKNLEKNKLDS